MTIFHQLTVDVLNLKWNFRLKHQIPLKKDHIVSWNI